MPITVLSPFAMQPNFVRQVIISQITILKPIRVIQILIFIIHNIDAKKINFIFREGKDGLQRQTDILAMVKDFSSKEKLSSWVIHYEVTIPLSKQHQNNKQKQKQNQNNTVAQTKHL